MPDLQHPFQHYQRTDDLVVIVSPKTYKFLDASHQFAAYSQMPKIYLGDTSIARPTLSEPPSANRLGSKRDTRPASHAILLALQLNSPGK